MTHIAGHGRYAREAYPERSAGAPPGSLVRVGYDVVQEELEVEAPTGENIYIPRNSALAPLEVMFPAFTLGNTLEIDFRLNSQEVNIPEPGLATVTTTIAVSVDGGITFYTLMPSASYDEIDTNNTASVLLRSLDSIRIVDPMPISVGGVPSTTPVTAPPIVRVFYFFSDPGETMLLNGVGSDETSIPSAVLKCSELAASSVFQGPHGILFIEGVA